MSEPTYHDHLVCGHYVDHITDVEVRYCRKCQATIAVRTVVPRDQGWSHRCARCSYTRFYHGLRLNCQSAAASHHARTRHRITVFEDGTVYKIHEYAMPTLFDGIPF